MPLVSWRQVAAHLQTALRGEFSIEREVGRGGMAAVYLARERRLNRWVALKVMSPSLLSGHGMVERFQQEAVTVANLQHANIVTVHAVRDIDDLHFFVMQYVDGRALDRILADVRQLPLAAVRSILFQVGSALSYAHRRGVVHRDIKPANILIDRTGDAIVTDFGIAKVAESSAHTQTGMLIGTPTYMSPEQCLGTPVSAASDQYALGLVAYELLAGRVPFMGPSLAVLQAQISETPRPLDELAPDCPPDVAAAVTRMLAKNPADRWPSIAQAVAAIGGGPLAEEDPLRETLAAMAAGPQTATIVAPEPPTEPPAPEPPPPPIPATVQVELPVGDWEPGDTVQPTATVLAEDGTPMPDAETRWESATAEVAEVDPETGRITLRRPGVAVIHATCGGAHGEASLTVGTPRPVSIEIDAPPDPLRAAESWQPIVRVLDRRGAAVDVAHAIESLDPDVAVVAAGDRIDALLPGGARLRVSAGEIERMLALTIAPAAVAVLDLEVAARQLEAGERIRCTATAKDRLGRPLGDVAMRWRSSDPRVATVDETGEVVGIVPGSVTISVHAESSERRASTQIAVRAAAVASLELGPRPAALRPGERTALVAVARDRRGQALDRPVRWTSADPSIVTVDARGTAEARAPGSATVTAACEGQRASTQVDVMVASITELFAPPPPAPPPPPPAAVTPPVTPPAEAPSPGAAVVAGPEPVSVAARPQPVAAAAPTTVPVLEVPAPARDVARAPSAPAVVPPPIPVAAAAAAPVTAPADPPVAPRTIPVARPVTPSTPSTAPAAPISPPVAATAAPTSSPASPPRRSRALVPAVVGAAVILGLGWWWMGRSGGSTAAASGSADQPTVAAPAQSPPPAAAPTPSAPAASPAANEPAVPATAAPAAAPVPPPDRKQAAVPATPPAKREPTPNPKPTAADRRAGDRPATKVDSPATRAVTTVPPVSATTERPVESRPSVPAPVPIAPPARETASAPAAAAPAASGVNEARAGIQRTIGDYVDAIGARDIGAMQRAFPSLPASTRQSWQQLFGMVKSLDAQAAGLQIGPVDADAGIAEFGLAVSYPSLQTRKRTCTISSRFRMRLVRAGGTWHIAEQTQLASSNSAGCG